MNNEQKTEQWLVGLNRGIEIGASETPLPHISPIYVSPFKERAGQNRKVDIQAEATDLPFSDNELDYVASSHVLEHIANPLKALVEWTRVTRHEGIVYLLIPDRHYTWERNRPAVLAEHLLEDFYAGVNQCDGTHVDEFVDTLVWEEFSPSDPSAQARENYRTNLKESIAQGLAIDIHFHAYDPASFLLVLEAANSVLPKGEKLELVDFETRFPDDRRDGFLAVLKVDKPAAPIEGARWLDRIRALFLPERELVPT